MNEPVTLTASGYSWTCPTCGKSNYERQVGAKLECAHCGESILVERVIHKVGNSPGMITIEAAGYSFQCPECRETVYVGVVTKEVKCRACHAVMSVQWLKHKIDSVIYEPTDSPVQVTEKQKEQIPVLPTPIAEQVDNIVQAKEPKQTIPSKPNQDQLSLAL